jgi:hypothetical protein
VLSPIGDEFAFKASLTAPRRPSMVSMYEQKSLLPLLQGGNIIEDVQEDEKTPAEAGWT